MALERDLGARVVEDGVVFTVWAPRQQSVGIAIEGTAERQMERFADGYFRLHVPGARAGQQYWFTVAEGRCADPASRWQPDGVFGPSMVVDPAQFAWTDTQWPGAAPPHQQVIYEMHLGTFTLKGTWAAAQERLPQLAALGVTTIEVMPIAEFAGRFGWGYDGVFLFAPYHRYGTPDDARRFVDAAHAAGLAVILDVVYNHIGPVGSVLTNLSDTYFSRHESEWGSGFNLDGPDSAPVRQFMRANVRLWIEDYHFDGLRFDAVHAIIDRSPEHIIDELTRCAREWAATRRLYLTAENEAQQVSFLTSDERGTRGVDGIWNEDWHHAAFVALTGRREAYFTDYSGSASEFASMARWNLLYQGQWYTWQNKRRGSDARDLPGSAFVCFLENHDQVANTGAGTRLPHVTDPALWRAMTALLLLGPAVPLLFQGQEQAVTAPFIYFADHEGDLAEAVRVGREEFLSQFPSLRDPEFRRRMPAPSSEDAYRQCQIDWQQTPDGVNAWRLHTDLLALRRNDSVIARAGTREVAIASSAPTPTVITLRYRREDEERLILVNLGALTTLGMNDPLFAAPAGQEWTLVWCSEHVDYGGNGMVDSVGEGPWTLQAHRAWLLRSVPESGPRT
jgi:maltooligosyltrehalose trehalohydrolase